MASVSIITLGEQGAVNLVSSSERSIQIQVLHAQPYYCDFYLLNIFLGTDQRASFIIHEAQRWQI